MTDHAPIGFGDVDRHPDTEALLASMREADAYPAVQVLRLWSGAQLRLRAGSRLLDVGCGPGSAALALADSVTPGGAVVGVDTSARMVHAARRQAEGRADVVFQIGDALMLPFAEDSFDAYRSERTWQWLADARGALAEALRVVRPGGRIGVIDSDWGTLAIDHPDHRLTARLLAAPRPIPPSPWMGRQLMGLMRVAGLEEIAVRAESLVATALDHSRAPGVAPFPAVMEMATKQGLFTDEEAARWLSTLESEAEMGRFFLSLTMFAVVGTKPS